MTHSEWAFAGTEMSKFCPEVTERELAGTKNGKFGPGAAGKPVRGASEMAG